MDFEEWAQIGWENGWVSAPVCLIHDGMPTTADEDEDMDEGHDPCIHIMRLYEDNEQRLGVESYFSPAQWRASNRGWNHE